MNKYQVDDFAQAGTNAGWTVFLEKGTDALEGYGHSLEPHFRQLGLPTKLNFQKIELLSDVFVCRDGQELSVEQCKLLKLLGHKMAKFNLSILVHRGKTGKVKKTDDGEAYLIKIKE